MSTMFKEVQDSEELDGTQEKMPDVILEHGSTRVTVDLTAIEWIIVALITAIVGMTIYLVS